MKKPRKEIGKFSPKQKPIRVGAYKTEFRPYASSQATQGFSWWNGMKWSKQMQSLKEAKRVSSGDYHWYYYGGACQEKSWWGLEATH